MESPRPAWPQRKKGEKKRKKARGSCVCSKNCRSVSLVAKGHGIQRGQMSCKHQVNDKEEVGRVGAGGEEGGGVRGLHRADNKKHFD